MNIHGIDKFWRSVNWLRRRPKSNGLILMYHNIIEADSDPWSLCVTPQHFAEHLEVLQKYGCPMQLRQFAQALRRGNLPHRAVVVTFDDGYADNLHNAKPLLEQYDMPATVFLITGHVGCEREFWWDELDRVLLRPGTLPEMLYLIINGSTYRWELGKAAFYSEDDYRYNQDWKVWWDKPNARYSLYCSLYQILLALPGNEQQKVLDEILTWAGAEPVVRPTHRCLSLEEMFALAEGELIEIGAHTVTHPFLSAHSLGFQQDEIRRSKLYLEKMLGHPVTSFSYPHGDYKAETVALVRKAKFACACSTVSDIVWRHTDCFQLPRFQVEDWDGEEFERMLLSWFNDKRDE